MKCIYLFLFFFICIQPLFGIIHKIGELRSDHPLKSSAVVHNICYTVENLISPYSGKLKLIDVSDPANPQLLSFLNLFSPECIVVQDDIAYVADRDLGLRLINVSNPLSPSFISACNTPESAVWVDIVGDLAYVADMGGGVQIIDISNPYLPYIVGSRATPAYATAVQVVGNYAYVVCYTSGIQIMDISNPHLPQIVSSYSTTGIAISIGVNGNIAYVGDNEETLTVLDVTDPQNLVVLATYYQNITSDIQVDGNSVSFFEYNRLWKTYDATDPTNIILKGTYDAGDFVAHATVVNNVVYLATDHRLEIIDISNPEQREILSSCHTGTETFSTSIQVVDNKAYITERYSGLSVFDISDPVNPILLYFYNSGGMDKPPTMIGNIAYIPAGGEGLKVVDFSNPQDPQLLGIYGGGDYEEAYCISIQDDKAYVQYTSELKIYDITNPQNLQLLGSVEMGGAAKEICIKGRYLYLAMGDWGLWIMDVIDPENPHIIGTYDYPDPLINVITVTVRGNMVYSFTGEGGINFITLFDVADPTNPTLFQSFIPHPISMSGSLYIQDNLLFAVDMNWNEIDIYDITNPTPILLNQFRWNRVTNRMYIENGLLYTANDYMGFSILDLSAILPVSNDDPIVLPQNQLSLSNYPNPFNPSTTINFNLPQAGFVSLDIYNIRGQKVKSLVQENCPMGNHTISWSGLNDQGNAIASGVYFAKINSGGKTISRKLVLLK